MRKIILLFSIFLYSCYHDQSCPDYPQYDSLRDEYFELTSKLAKRFTANSPLMPGVYYDSLCEVRKSVVDQLNSLDCPAMTEKFEKQDCEFVKKGR